MTRPTSDGDRPASANASFAARVVSSMGDWSRWYIGVMPIPITLTDSFMFGHSCWVIHVGSFVSGRSCRVVHVGSFMPATARVEVRGARAEGNRARPAWEGAVLWGRVIPERHSR